MASRRSRTSRICTVALVLACRQVDDFAIASKMEAASQKLIAIINERATTDDQGTGAVTDQAVINCYNGLDVHQTCEYIKLSFETNIQRMLQTHG